MIGDWFWKWSKENPKNIYGPGILIGAIGGAVFVGAMIVTWGQPYETTTQQTGPRGTAMGVVKFTSDIEAGNPSVASYAETIAAAAASEAEVVDSPVSDELTRAMREWTGIPTLYSAREDSYQNMVASMMIGMTQAINSEWDGHVGDTGVNCYTCHRGEAVPSGIWFQVHPAVEVMEGWGAVQNRVTAVSQFTSLPSDALLKLLVEDGRITVHDLDPRVANEPGDPTWQDTERTFSLMNYFSNSLNTNCTFCHNSRAFYDTAEVTPQWATASIGIQMVRELNVDYLSALDGILPEERLGPIHGDTPKAACMTCHKGYQKPIADQDLQSVDMVSGWSEIGAE